MMYRTLAPIRQAVALFGFLLFLLCLSPVPARAQVPAGDARISLNRHTRRVALARSGACPAALVVDRGGADRFLRVRLDFTFLRGAQPAGHFRASAMVVVGRSEDGGAHAHRKNERRSPPLRGSQKLKNLIVGAGLAPLDEMAPIGLVRVIFVTARSKLTKANQNPKLTIEK